MTCISHSVQIQSLEQEMSRALPVVRQCLNSHDPTIRKIPPQILIVIASHLITDAAFIVTTTHVCHHWRGILLSRPNLWTRPNFAREKQALSFLQRSGQLLIHVDLATTSPSQSLINLLCLHSARVHTLKIGRFAGLQKLLHQPLTSLRSFEVATPDDWDKILAMRSAAREFPTLTSLAISHNPSGLAFRGSRITRLSVSMSNLGGSEVAELLSLLRSCALLEELHIDNKTGLEGCLLILPKEVIPLPRLRCFAQTLYNWNRTGIINNLCLPPSCSVAFKFQPGRANGYLPLYLPCVGNNSYFTNVKRLKVVYTDGHLGRKVCIILDLINDRGTRFVVVTEYFNDALSLSGGEHSWGGGIALSTSLVEVLYVDGHRHMPLENFQCLTTLILTGAAVRTYLDLLVEPKNLYTCKSLRALVLSITPGLPTSYLVRCLLKAAQTRAKAGHPLRTVTFACSSTLAPTDLAVLEGLRKCVERVELLLGDDTLDWNLDKYFLNCV